MKMTLKKVLSFISYISSIRYNIQLTLMGKYSTLLQSKLAHKEATGNTAHLPYLWSCHAYIHLQFFCFIDLQKNRCMRKQLSRQIYVFDLNLPPRHSIHWTLQQMPLDQFFPQNLTKIVGRQFSQNYTTFKSYKFKFKYPTNFVIWNKGMCIR